jgi:hypothetical protein
LSFLSLPRIVSLSHSGDSAFTENCHKTPQGKAQFNESSNEATRKYFASADNIYSFIIDAFIKFGGNPLSLQLGGDIRPTVA